MSCFDRGLELRDAATYAYERFRVEVIDHLPEVRAITLDALEPAQQVVLVDLVTAERELAEYREQRFHPTTVDGQRV